MKCDYIKIFQRLMLILLIMTWVLDLGYGEYINKEVLVLEENVSLLNKYEKGKVIKTLKKYEKLKVMDERIIKGYIAVETVQGERGWVKEKYTSYVPKKWKQYKFGKGVEYAKMCAIFVPNEEEFTYRESKSKTHDNSKLYNSQYFIVVDIYQRSVYDEINKIRKKCDSCMNKEIEEIKHIYKQKCKKEINMDEEPKKYYIEYNNKKIVFIDELFTVFDWTGRYYVIFLLNDNENIEHSFSIFTYEICYEEEYFLKAKKIALSAHFITK